MRAIVTQFSDELAALVSGTIAPVGTPTRPRTGSSCCSAATSSSSRINGTIVGGIAGVAIHGAGQLL
ncbi:MAG: hypothetical protein KatS3mg010_2008 [Acidimicrobiia bacterium]|nr:MAG: hypothetical protein KatS3mg010_2008 [Acidimicrobiia bacterium]